MHMDLDTIEFAIKEEVNTAISRPPFQKALDRFREKKISAGEGGKGERGGGGGKKESPHCAYPPPDIYTWRIKCSPAEEYIVILS